VPVPLVDQLAAAGELFSKMYDRLQYWCYEGEGYYGENYLEYIKSVFDTQADFEKYFLTPCIILSYNTGERGASEVINAFAQSDEFRKLKESKVAGGYNTFQAMCDFGKASPLSQLADFKEEAPTYVQRAYAFAEILSPDHEGPMLVAQL
jgi:hypothetical protein